MYPSFNKFLSLTTLSVCLVSLSGCDSFRNTFGLDHYQPDEFKVSDNPPLSIPKDYRLRPPANGQNNNNQAGATVSTTRSSQAQAQNLLLGTSSPTRTSNGAGEQSLLSMASSQQQATPNIRDTVDKEAAVATNVSDTLIQRIMGWREEAAKNIASINGEQLTPQTNTIANEQKVN